jgi:hypothetical protein
MVDGGRCKTRFFAIRHPPSAILVAVSAFFTLKPVYVYYPRLLSSLSQIRGSQMDNKILVSLVLIMAAANFGMARSGQYDEEARAQEKIQKQTAQETEIPEKRHPAKNFAKGVKEMTVDNVKDTLGDTAHGTMSEKPVIGTLDGTQQAGEKVVDNTIKGVKKVASLGYAKDDSYEIEQAEDKSGDAAKIKLFKF